MLITKEFLRERFIYKNSQLYYRVSPNPRTVAVGSLAGTKTSKGARIMVDNKPYWARDLVWIYHKGPIPEGYRVSSGSLNTDNLGSLELIKCR
jgi:hypothetical protein